MGMNDKEKVKNVPLVPVKVEGAETVDVIIRNINGEGVIFTTDGKVVGQQVADAGYYYYQGYGPNRKKYYRATFLVDVMPSDKP
jgi:hypothetical protein